MFALSGPLGMVLDSNDLYMVSLKWTIGSQMSEATLKQCLQSQLRSGRFQGFPWDAASVEKWAMAIRLQRPLQHRHPGVNGIEVGCGWVE